jgi:hypothetical protein
MTSWNIPTSETMGSTVPTTRRHDFFFYIEKPIMENDNQHKPNKGNEKALQPDEETLGTTDPQEHMKGPVSSLMQKAKDGAHKNDNTEKEKKKHDDKKDATGGDFIHK